jgi:hypothetical protein
VNSNSVRDKGTDVSHTDIPQQGTGDGGFILSTQPYYRRFFYYLILNCYMSWLYDHLQAEIYYLGFI